MGGYFKNRTAKVSAPVDLLPPGMLEVNVREICGGELYSLSFRKPSTG